MAQISIAVPVYNGDSMLEAALACLQRQTFRDFEVLILDNASTDGTRAIAQRFVDADRRFSLRVQPVNKGAMGNFIDGIDWASARFYLWRAFDDLTDDNYLAELHGLLVADARMKLATGITRTLFLDGTKVRRHAPPRLTGIEAIDIVRLMFRSHAGWFYGVWDLAALRPVWDSMLELFPHPWASDHLILFPFLLDRSIALTERTTFVKYTKRTAAMGRDRRRPPVAEMLRFRRDFQRWCGAQIDVRFGSRPIMRAMLHAALWVYTGKRVYRLRTVLRRAVVERFATKNRARSASDI